MVFEDIALIPARGGSKGLSRKNLIEISGKSLLQRAIDSAKDSRKFSNIYVSSEDSEIISLAKSAGASIIERNYRAATDLATAEDVVSDFISKIDVQKENLFRLTYLQPTSPFRTGLHISRAIEISDLHESSSCVSICKVKQHPDKMVQINDGSLASNSPSDVRSLSSNRQDLSGIYLPNGAIYIFPLFRFQEHHRFPIEGSGYFEMDDISSIDIDSELDLALARALES